MQNIKKICLITLLLLFSNCGYKVLDTSKLNNFFIKEIETTGDKRVSFKIKNNLLINTNQNNKSILLLELNTKKTKSVKEKNIKNEITKYEIILSIDLKFNELNSAEKHSINFSINGDYTIGSNYSATLNNEKKIIENLIENASDKILNEIGLKLNDI